MCRDHFQPDDIVKTCCNLESGLNLVFNGLRACTRGALMPPLFCSADEIVQGLVTKEFIIEKRKEYIRMLNDNHSEIDCKSCLMVEEKRYGDISFDRLGHVDLQHYTVCNLRCVYCAYTRDNVHLYPQYDALAVLNLFSPEDIEWNAHVDFAGGEPALLENLGTYLDFFRSRRIRVMMFTNGVHYHKAIYDGLADGTIYIATVSLDAGTPTTYSKIRGRDKYIDVMENLSRYATSGSAGKGMLAVKYIFCDSNCSNDDIVGFAYAMLALRPQQIWLTFDFAPLFLRLTDYDYTQQIHAYAKLYLLLKKHGVEAFHYFQEAVATVSREGRDIMDRVMAEIARQSSGRSLNDADLLFSDFRKKDDETIQEPDMFSVNPLVLKTKSGTKTWSLAGKRVLLAPACPATQKLRNDPDVRQAEWIGFVDRNPLQQGKILDGATIYGYEAIGEMNVDAVLLIPPVKHRKDIIASITRYIHPEIVFAEIEYLAITPEDSRAVKRTP